MIKPNPNVAAMGLRAARHQRGEGLEPIVLAQNEHAYPPSQAVRDAVAAALDRAQLYSDSEWTNCARSSPKCTAWTHKTSSAAPVRWN